MRMLVVRMPQKFWTSGSRLHPQLPFALIVSVSFRFR